eukprot:12269.XXX_358022_358351_1 [CDS] Oithona nana genome sequencing.
MKTRTASIFPAEQTLKNGVFPFLSSLLTSKSFSRKNLMCLLCPERHMVENSDFIKSGSLISMLFSMEVSNNNMVTLIFSSELALISISRSKSALFLINSKSDLTIMNPP